MDADTFASGRQFIELLEAMPSLRVDCVVLDVQMPGLNGLQVQEHPQLAATAEALCRRLIERFAAAVTGPRRDFLAEDYLVFAIESSGPEVEAAALLEARGPLVAAS